MRLYNNKSIRCIRYIASSKQQARVRHLQHHPINLFNRPHSCCFRCCLNSRLRFALPLGFRSAFTLLVLSSISSQQFLRSYFCLTSNLTFLSSFWIPTDFWILSSNEPSPIFVFFLSLCAFNNCTLHHYTCISDGGPYLGKDQIDEGTDVEKRGERSSTVKHSMNNE